MTSLLPSPDSLALPLSHNLAYVLNLKKCGIHATGKFWIAQGLVLPISIALITLTALGLSGTISSSIVGWSLCAIGITGFVSNLIWGQIKYRKTLFAVMALYSLAMISVGALGGMGLIPLWSFSLALLPTYFFGVAFVCYGMGYSASSADDYADKDRNGDTVAAGQGFPSHLREVYSLHGSNEFCPFCTSLN